HLGPTAIIEHQAQCLAGTVMREDAIAECYGVLADGWLPATKLFVNQGKDGPICGIFSTDCGKIPTNHVRMPISAIVLPCCQKFGSFCRGTLVASFDMNIGQAPAIERRNVSINSIGSASS